MAIVSTKVPANITQIGLKGTPSDQRRLISIYLKILQKRGIDLEKIQTDFAAKHPNDDLNSKQFYQYLHKILITLYVDMFKARIHKDQSDKLTRFRHVLTVISVDMGTLKKIMRNTNPIVVKDLCEKYGNCACSETVMTRRQFELFGGGQFECSSGQSRKSDTGIWSKPQLLADGSYISYLLLDSPMLAKDYLLQYSTAHKGLAMDVQLVAFEV